MCQYFWLFQLEGYCTIYCGFSDIVLLGIRCLGIMGWRCGVDLARGFPPLHSNDPASATANGRT